MCGAWYVTVVKHSWNCNGLDTRVFKIVKVPACYWNCCIAIVGVMSYFIVLILFPDHNICSFMNFIENSIKILDRLTRDSLLKIVATFVFLRGSEICRGRLKIDQAVVKSNVSKRSASIMASIYWVKLCTKDGFIRKVLGKSFQALATVHTESFWIFLPTRSINHQSQSRRTVDIGLDQRFLPKWQNHYQQNH